MPPGQASIIGLPFLQRVPDPGRRRLSRVSSAPTTIKTIIRSTPVLCEIRAARFGF